MLDRWKGLQRGDPRREVVERRVPQRTRKKDWRNQNMRTLDGMGEGIDCWEDRHSEEPGKQPPWRVGTPFSIQKTDVRKTDPVEEQLAGAEQCIASAGEVDVTIYTDGSAVEGVKMGGGGVAIYRRGTLVEEMAVPAGALCSSYSAELEAMKTGVRWLKNRADWGSAAIITDSLSLVEALRGRPRGGRLENLQEMMWSLEGEGRDVKIIWAPGHCGLPGNERADELARRGGEMEQSEIMLDRATREAYIKRKMKGEKNYNHERVRATYVSTIKERDEERELSRSEQVDLSRFRAGHHTRTRRWRVMIGDGDDATCRVCGEEEESTEHLWLRCPAFERDRHHLQMGYNLSELVDKSISAMALLRIILRRLGD
jgi:ribonuclease HI